MDFFLRLLQFANWRGLLLLRWLQQASIEIDDYQTMSKNTKQMFQPRNTLKCQILLKKKKIFIILILSWKEDHGLLFEMKVFLRLLFQTQEGTSFRNGSYFFLEIKPAGLLFEAYGVVISLKFSWLISLYWMRCYIECGILYLSRYRSPARTSLRFGTWHDTKTNPDVCWVLQSFWRRILWQILVGIMYFILLQTDLQN